MGQVLRELPLISKALIDKVISFTRAKVLTRTATPATEGELVELAQRVTAAELPKAIAWWSQRSEPDAVPSQVVVDLMTGPGRNPNEAEELLSWMQANEEAWRRKR